MLCSSPLCCWCGIWLQWWRLKWQITARLVSWQWVHWHGPRWKKEVSVANLMELTAERYFLCRCTCFELQVSCCHSTLPCNWFALSRGGGSNIGCRCWRLVLSSVYWFLGHRLVELKRAEFFLFFSLFLQDQIRNASTMNHRNGQLVISIL